MLRLAPEIRAVQILHTVCSPPAPRAGNASKSLPEIPVKPLCRDNCSTAVGRRRASESQTPATAGEWSSTRQNSANPARRPIELQKKCARADILLRALRCRCHVMYPALLFQQHLDLLAQVGFILKSLIP